MYEKEKPIVRYVLKIWVWVLLAIFTLSHVVFIARSDNSAIAGILLAIFLGQATNAVLTRQD